MRLKWYVVLLITAVLVTTSLNAAAAEEQFFIYSVKFLCGLQTQAPSSPPREPPVKPGNYATAVNIHNFHLASNVPAAVFCKKAVIANPQSAQRGEIGTFRQETLHPDEALEVDCSDIVNLLPPSTVAPLPPFIKGFVEIVSPVELSVVAVYTSRTCLNPGNTATGRCIKLGELDLEVVPQPFHSEPPGRVPDCVPGG